MKRQRNLPVRGLTLAAFALGLGLALNTVNLAAQTENATSSTSVEERQKAQDQRIQQLQEKLDDLQQELIKLKAANVIDLSERHITTAKASAPPTSISSTPAPEELPVTSPPKFKVRALCLCGFHLAEWQRANERYTIRD